MARMATPLSGTIRMTLAALGLALMGPTFGCTPTPPPTAQGLPPENQRAARQSQCGQNVIVCTVSFPTPVINVVALEGQEVFETPDGFRVVGVTGGGSEAVQLVGSDSTAGQGATEIFFSWSFGATDDDPCTLEPGEEFSAEADPQVFMRAGLHYIRLTVTNDLPSLETVEAGECGTFENFRRYDFIEVEIEVIND